MYAVMVKLQLRSCLILPRHVYVLQHLPQNHNERLLCVMFSVVSFCVHSWAAFLNFEFSQSSFLVLNMKVLIH